MTSKWKCPSCGRVWAVAGSRTGFVKAAAFTHISLCEKRTPEQRRLANKIDEAAWATRPPKSKITNDPEHAGLKEPNQNL